VGRKEEARALVAMLEAGERLVTVVGPPGVGKTRLAAHAAAAFGAGLAARGGGVYNVDLEAAKDALGVCRAVAAALDVSLGADAIEQVGRALSRKRARLFVLDSFEHLTSLGPETLGIWLAQARDVQLLVTSREALRLTGERVLSLGPLGLPRSTDEVWGSEAGELFLARAAAARSEYTEIKPDAAAVANIVSRLEGLPLAIELAAGLLGHMDAAQVLAAVTRSPMALASDRRDAPARHASLLAAIDASWLSLSPSEQRALSCATVFRGGFTLDAAEAVLDLGEARSLRSLVDKSLLRVSRPHASLPSRFSMYEAVRELAAARIDPADRERTAARHAAYFLGHGEAIADTLDTSAAGLAVRTILAEADNLMAVHTAALEASPPRAEIALRAALVLDRALSFRGPAALHLGLLDRALSASGERTTPALRAKALVSRARARRLCGPLGRARADLEQALSIAVEIRRSDVEAEALTALGMLACDTGDRAGAAERLTRALAVAKRAGNEAREGDVRNGLGTLARISGRPGEAEEQYEHACSVHRSSGNRRGEMHALANLASLKAELDRDDAAEEHARVLSLAEDLSSTQITGLSRAGLGVWLQRRGRFAEARASMEAALAIFQDIGDQRLAASVVANLGTLLHETGDVRGALAAFEQGLSIARSIGASHAEGMFLSMMGGALAALDLTDRARSVLDEAEQRAADPLGRDFVGLARAHLDLAVSRQALALGDAERAQASRAQAARRIDLAEGRSGDAVVRPSLVDLWTDALFTVRILRARMESDPPIEAPRFEVVLDERLGEVRYRGGSLSLDRRPVVRALLCALAEAGGEPIPKEALCERVFGHAYRSERDDNPLRVNVNRLRSFVEPSGLRVEFSGGYRLVAPAGFLYLRAGPS